MVILGNEVIDLNLKTPWGDRVIKLRRARSVYDFVCNSCSYNNKCRSINIAPLIEPNNLLCKEESLVEMCNRIDIDLLGKSLDDNTVGYIPEPNTFEDNIPELFKINK